MLKLQYASAPFWSIVGQNQLKYKFLMLVLVKYMTNYHILHYFVEK